MKVKRIITLTTFIFLQAFLYAQTVRPVVSNINVSSTANSKIKISWNIPQFSEPQILGFKIFRDTRVINSTNQLLTQKLVGELSSSESSYTDTVSDAREYYYCVICSTKDGSYNVILPSVNSTVSGIRAATKTQSQEEEIVLDQKSLQNDAENDDINSSEKIRSIPLPTLGLKDNQGSSKNILGPKALDCAKTLGRKYTGSSSKITKMYVFENDLICPEGGDDYYLFKILKTTFVKKQFTKSINELTDFLSIHREDEVTSRAIFYLGESYYFAKEYEKAVFQFLAVQEKYPELCKRWIDSSLDQITVK